MIEEASVGIAMLCMVSVVLVADDGSSVSDRVALPNSPYLKWVKVAPSGVGRNTQYHLEIGIGMQYDVQRIPEPLKNGVSVHLCPVLYEVGVDIWQWGAHQEMKVKDQLTTTQCVQPVVITDDDVLVTLNYEAFQKINACAHLISPAPRGSPLETGISDIHPTLT